MIQQIAMFTDMSPPTLFSYEKRLLSSSPSSPPLSLRECEEMMADLKDKYPDEYVIYNLSSVAVAMAFPLVKEYIQVTAYCRSVCVHTILIVVFFVTVYRAGTC